MRILVGLGLASALLAQEQDVVMHRPMMAMQTAGAPQQATFAFIAAAGAEGGKLVKGAPYSGESTSETVRVLADGTRITNKNTTSMARDGEGRMRRETSLTHIGPWATGGQAPPRFVTITDPVLKETYVLNLTDRTAQKAKLGEPMVFRDVAQEGNTRRVTEQRVQIRTSGGEDVVGMAGGLARTLELAGPPPGAGMRTVFDSRNAKTESLGTQTMEGVRVEGTRTTHTIPAGEIGNDRPIVSTTERWFSPELQMVVSSKTVDPQIGETTYRVTNLRRSEPDPSLFKIPGDFKVTENQSPRVIMRKFAAEPQPQPQPE
jgi:hypothetical protein